MTKPRWIQIRIAPMAPVLLGLFLSLPVMADTLDIPRYRYAFSPHFGYQRFDANKGLINGTNVGFQFSEYLSKDFAVGAGVDFIRTARSGSTTQTQSLVGLRTQAMYTFLQVQPWMSLYGMAGLKSMFYQGSMNADYQLGFGARLHISDKTSSRMELSYGQDSMGIIALEQRFDSKLDRQTWQLLSQIASENELMRFRRGQLEGDLAQKNAQIAESLNTAGIDPSYKVEAVLTAPSVIVHYYFREKSFADIQNHWAKLDVLALTKMGFIEGQHITKNVSVTVNAIAQSPTESTIESEDIFDPMGYVTRAQAAELLILTMQMREIQKKSIAPISFTLNDLPSVPLLVDLTIADRKGNLVRTLLKKHPFYATGYVLNWDGLNDKNERVPEGSYQVSLAFKYKDKLLGNKVVATRVFAAEKPIYDPKNTSANVVLEDVTENNKSKDFIKAAVDLDVIPAYLVEESKRVFNPNEPINKIDYIVAIAKVLRHYGAYTKGVMNLTSYSDYELVPEYARADLDLYISTLGYGGDEQNALTPLNLISRAEAVVMSNRLLIWIEQAHKAASQFK